MDTKDSKKSSLDKIGTIGANTIFLGFAFLVVGGIGLSRNWAIGPILACIGPIAMLVGAIATGIATYGFTINRPKIGFAIMVAGMLIFLGTLYGQSIMPPETNLELIMAVGGLTAFGGLLITLWGW